VRAHRHTAGAHSEGICRDIAVPAADGGTMGRSRGGLRTESTSPSKAGRPLSILLTAGQAGDNRQPFKLLDAFRVHNDRPGRPRKTPDRRSQPKAYADGPHPPRTTPPTRQRPYDPPSCRTGRRPGSHGQPRRAATRLLTRRSIDCERSMNVSSSGSNNGVGRPPATPSEPRPQLR